jgi:hypothetical protein
MSYTLSRTEDDAEVKKAVDEAQGVYDAHGKWEWVEWAGKTPMPRLHAQIEMERADTMRAEQDAIEEERYQAEQAQQEEERAAKEAEFQKKEEEYIWQLDAKEIDEEKFRDLIGELDMERAMAESVAEGPATTQATTQDGEAGESEWEELAEEGPAAAEKAVESSTIGKGKRKVAPARAKVYAVMDEPVSDLICRRLSVLTHLLTVRSLLHAEDEAVMYHDTTRTALQEVPDRQEPMLLEGEEPRGHRGRGRHHYQEVEGRIGVPGGRVVEQGRGAGGGGA